MKGTVSNVPTRLDHAQLGSCRTSASYLEVNPSQSEIPCFQHFPSPFPLTTRTGFFCGGPEPFIAPLAAQAYFCCSLPRSTAPDGISWTEISFSSLSFIKQLLIINSIHLRHCLLNFKVTIKYKGMSI